MLKVHLVHEPDAQPRQTLEAALPSTVALSFGPSVPTDTEVLVSGRPGAERLDAPVDLKALVVPYAGIPPETLSLLRARPQLAVHNLHHNAAAVAEAAVSLLWAAAKSIVPMDASLRRHDWTPRFEPDPAIMLEGRRALILGFGAIGRRVARLCHGLGLSVAALRRSPGSQDDERVEVHGPEALDAQLALAQVLMVCLPHTSETEGMLGAERLARLPQGAVLVNIARALIIDEAALFEALSSGHLHSAGLDVWYRYPSGEAARTHTAPADHPFESLDNVVLSPHRSGHAGDIERVRMTHLAQVLAAMARGEAAPNRVDCALGY